MASLCSISKRSRARPGGVLFLAGHDEARAHDVDAIELVALPDPDAAHRGVSEAVTVVDHGS
jgi:hypothetical protein